MLRILKNQKGFTLTELILSMLIVSSIIGVAAETMISQAETYSFISNRKNTLADVRVALNQISYDIKRVDTDDISDITSSAIEFTDDEGNDTSYKLDTDGETLAIYKGEDVLLPNIEDFTITYYDEEGNELDADDEQIENVKRIQFTIETSEQAGEGNVTLSTMIIPRSFLGYSNYQ